MKSVVTEQW